jgi:hypothetical protein
MDKQNVLYAYMKYYSAMIKKEVPIHGATWLNLENMLSKISQTQKATHDSIYKEMANISKSIETKNRLVIARSQGAGRIRSGLLNMGVMKRF